MTAILKNTMKMLSLRFLASIAVIALMSAPLPVRASDDAPAENKAASNAAENSPAQDAVDEKSVETGKKPDKSDKKSDKNDKKSDKGDKKSDKKAKGDSKDEKEAKEEKETPEPLSATEAAAVAAAAERAKVLKTMVTPFNTASSQSQSNANDLSPLSLGGGGGHNTLRSRLLPNRVYLPGKLVIGKPAEFVVKGHPGYQAAIAMADKDSGAKPIGSVNLRLGADRKLMAAGTIPSTGVLTLIVDMPIQGDLIGLPVFFETVIWQKPDFSDIELAAPVKSEIVKEIADKPNALLVSEEKATKKGLRFVPESAVPQYQSNSDQSLESGRP